MRSRFVAVAVALIVVGPAAALAQQQVPATMRNEVLAFVRQYIDAENRADATALMDAVSRRADVSSINDGEIVRGWDAIRDQTDQIAGKQGSFRLSLGTIDVVPLGPQHALAMAPTTFVWQTQNGPVEGRGAMTLVLERGASGWKVVNEHYSSKQPSR